MTDRAKLSTYTYNLTRMKGLNKVTLIGNLGKEPEVKMLDEQVKVAKFTLATSETYRDSLGQKQTLTEWHNVVLWRRLAKKKEKYLNKGSHVYIEGKLRTRSYDDKNGNKRYVTEVVADSLLMLDKPNI